jgi:hypothetical protein
VRITTSASEDKIQICKVPEGEFDFLGFTVQTKLLSNAMCMHRTTPHGQDNTMPRLVHAERPADSEARILEKAQALNPTSPDSWLL